MEVSQFIFEEYKQTWHRWKAYHQPQNFATDNVCDPRSTVVVVLDIHASEWVLSGFILGLFNLDLRYTYIGRRRLSD